MKNSHSRILRASVATLLGLFLLPVAPDASAVVVKGGPNSSIWLQLPNNSDWNTGSNWDSGTAPNGTGDTVAALFTAHWLESGDIAAALGTAASSIYAVLEATHTMGERELQLVAAQDRLISPPRRFVPERL